MRSPTQKALLSDSIPFIWHRKHWTSMPKQHATSKLHAIFDTEIIGHIKPIFLTCIEIVETGERFTFWHDKRGHTKKLTAMLEDPQ